MCESCCIVWFISSRPDGRQWKSTRSYSFQVHITPTVWRLHKENLWGLVLQPKFVFYNVRQFNDFVPHKRASPVQIFAQKKLKLKPKPGLTRLMLFSWYLLVHNAKIPLSFSLILFELFELLWKFWNQKHFFVELRWKAVSCTHFLPNQWRIKSIFLRKKHIYFMLIPKARIFSLIVARKFDSWSFFVSKKSGI